MRKRVITLGVLLLVVLLTGCSTATPHTATSHNDIFSDENITVEFLKEKECLFYENFVFAKDDMNHVFVTNKDEIVEHYMYPEVEFNEDSFANVYNRTIVDAVEYIGTPSFAGISSEFSLDYSCNDGYIRRLKLSKNDGELLISNIEVLDKEDPTTWFDEEKTNLPSLEQCQQITVGMSIDEVVSKIGKPQRDVGYGARLFEFDIDNGTILSIIFDLDVKKENEYQDNNPNSSIYGTHALYVGVCWIH